MRGIKVPDPVRNLIIDRIKNGERVDDVASEFDLYPNTIRKWLSKAGISTPSNGNSKSSQALQISRLQREKQQLLEIIGELTVLTRESKKKSKRLPNS